MVYVSIVGTQAMGVLNPLLALYKENKNKLNKVILLATSYEKSAKLAQRLKDFIQLRKISENIEIIKITSWLVSESDNLKPAHEALQVIREAINDSLYFNFAGGMNFQIAAHIQTIEVADRDFFIYPEEETIHLVNIKQGKLYKSLLPLPDPVDVLELQGVPYKILNGNGQIPFEKEEQPYQSYLNGLSLNSAKRFVQINNVTFNYMLNIGNELRFIKFIHTEGNRDKRRSEDFLAQARALINFAVHRTDASDLYHKKVIVITNHRPVQEHLEKEGLGNIIVINRQNIQQNIEDLKQYLALSARQRTSNATFANKLQHAIQSQPILIKNEPISDNLKNDTVLIVALNKDIITTLMAVWTHKPETLFILYTQHNETINYYKNAIEQNINLLPASVKKVWLYPVSFFSDEIYEQLNIESNKNIQVNITPGTKPHAFFLSLLANKYNGSIYSIKTISSKITKLPACSVEEEMDLQFPSITDYLQLSGVKIQDCGYDKGYLLKEPMLKRVNAFFKKLKSQGKTFSDFINKPSDFSSFTLSRSSRAIDITFNGDSISLKADGLWFEQFIGYRLIECGADEAQVRLRTDWSNETREHLLKIYSRIAPLTDRDVCARFQSNYYVISCKADKGASLNQSTEEVRATAPLFGRFSAPLFCSLYYNEEPNKVNGVYVFGFDTFTDSDKLKALLTKAIQDKKTTD